MREKDELEARRRIRKQRIARATGRGGGGFFSSPQSAVVCMLVALGSILAFWGGLPRWALLALGVGALAVVLLAALLWRSRGRRGA